ncbi:DUF7683 domain-containing protein [Streptomyces boninensis]|uniref:DUF7683 domain-containing protein n=1 Tax=Streptomyces boninensis TaxID=2039455 RepID=UPI003B219533
MKWVLSGFGKEDERLHVEYQVSKEQLAAIRECVPPALDDPWYVHSYPVPRDAWPAIDQILGCGPPNPDLDYFVDGYADP